MHCIITAGPTYEPLDGVRRLTNFSSGRLGSELANYLSARGHEVTLLLGEQATYRRDSSAQRVLAFTTTASLRERLRELASQPVDALFHAAAVSDFSFGKVWARSPAGDLSEIRSGKLSTRQGPLLAELIPTAKILAELRGWFPRTRLVGWKYEVEGDRARALRLAEEQMADCLTDACVANGPAYGAGFGLVKNRAPVIHLADAAGLYAALDQLLLAVEPPANSVG